MRFLVDTNILLHAANKGSPFHSRSRDFLKARMRDRQAWCLTWPIVYEFLRVATHSRVFPSPLKAKQAIDYITLFTDLEEVTMLAPTAHHSGTLDMVVQGLSHPAGNLFHDIHTATLMREHGVPEIVTADTDFLQFRFLKVVNPLL